MSQGHAAAVILLGGWVVMFPPCVDSVRDANRVKTKCYPAAPMARWKAGPTYPSERLCKEAIARSHTSEGCWEPDTTGMGAAEAAKAASDARIGFSRWLHARCVLLPTSSPKGPAEELPEPTADADEGE